jgi:hypothetical protein
MIRRGASAPGGLGDGLRREAWLIARPKRNPEGYPVASPNFFTVKWPKAAGYQTKSLSGVLVETNVQRQVALHFFNEIREIEEEVQYGDDGSRTTEPRTIIYVRELSDTILIGEAAARQLRDMLLTLFPLTPPEEIN